MSKYWLDDDNDFPAPPMNPDGTAKGSRGALWCVLGVLFLAIVAVLAIVALGGAP